jgi:hypothetical protein
MTIGMSFLVAAALLLTPAPAAAYLDPATGSMVFQIAAGAILTAMAATKIYWRQLMALFRGKDKSADAESRSRN